MCTFIHAVSASSFQIHWPREGFFDVMSSKALPKSKWYTCPQCPDWPGCSSAAGFHKHNFKHDPAFQFKCDTCGKVNLGKIDHNRHLRTHDEAREKCFVCLCSNSYMSNQALLKHFRTVKVTYFLLHTFMASYVQLKVPAPDGAGLHRRVAEHKDRKRKSAVSPTKTKAVRSVSKK